MAGYQKPKKKFDIYKENLSNLKIDHKTRKTIEKCISDEIFFIIIGID